MRDRNVNRWSELKVEQLARNPEDPLAQLFELEVRLYFILIEIVFRFAHSLHVIAIVPRFDLDTSAFFISEGLHVGDFLMHTRDRRLPNGQHQFHRALRRFGHRVLKPPVSMRRKAEQLRPLSSQLQNLCNVLVVVMLVTAIAAHYEHAPDLLAQIAAI